MPTNSYFTFTSDSLVCSPGSAFLPRPLTVECRPTTAYHRPISPSYHAHASYKFVISAAIHQSLTIANSTINSDFHYCNSILLALDFTKIRRLQLKQNSLVMTP